MEKKSCLVGNVQIGGGAPVSVQSMLCTDPLDADACLKQLGRLREAGCDIARLTVPDMAAADTLAKIRARSPLPLVADIHFDCKLALLAVEAGADKIRINPGNIGGPEKVRAVAEACRRRNIPIRVGVNAGSLEKTVLEKYGGVCPEALCESALYSVSLLEQCDFTDIVVSVKSSDVRQTVLANRLLHERCPYPLHIGVTEAGTLYTGLVKSSAGLGALLVDGIGDTIRVSLSADPVQEVRAGRRLLSSLGLRQGAQVIACPTCGRTQVDVITLAGQVEDMLEGCEKPLTIAVMGCVVNGPGEAAAADIGLAGGRGEYVLFKKGQVLRKVRADEALEALRREMEEFQG